MATLAAILDEMSDAIRNVVVQVTDVDTQVEPRMVLNPSPPCIDMYPGDPSTDPETAAFGEEIGGELITVRVRVDTADNEAGQNLLLAFMDDEDPLSIVNALADEPTLNGLASSLDVRGRSGYALFPVPQGDGVLLGCLFNLIVLKAHS
jgi:hypothetical protein